MSTNYLFTLPDQNGNDFATAYHLPLVLYFFFPPEIKETPNASQFAKDKLQELGPMNRGEKIMLGIFAILLLLWAGIPAMIFG